MGIFRDTCCFCYSSSHQNFRFGSLQFFSFLLAPTTDKIWERTRLIPLSVLTSNNSLSRRKQELWKFSGLQNAVYKNIRTNRSSRFEKGYALFTKGPKDVLYSQLKKAKTLASSCNPRKNSTT